MARTKAPDARAVFEKNMVDARVLLDYARALHNKRKNTLRAEMRDRLGEALRVPKSGRDKLDGLQSELAFMIILDKSKIDRSVFTDAGPLLRPAIVAACAALETFVADRVIERIGDALRATEVPKRLREIPMSVGDWSDIERKYSRRGWGVRKKIDEAIREMSSTSPSKLGQTLSTIGIKDWAQKVDTARRVKKGTTVDELEKIATRRNRIAHSADRVGTSTAKITIEEVEEIVAQIESIAQALDSVFRSHVI